MISPDDSFLKALAPVRPVLMYSFDLELLDPPTEPDDFAVPDAECRIFARDMLSGAYAICTSSGQGRSYCIHVDAAGGASPFARDLREAVALVVALPYWRDVLKYSSGGDWGEMRRAAHYFERSILEEFPDLPLVREDLHTTLPLPRLDDPVGLLHHMAVDSKLELSIYSPKGWIYESMVGDRSVTDLMPEQTRP